MSEHIPRYSNLEKARNILGASLAALGLSACGISRESDYTYRNDVKVVLVEDGANIRSTPKRLSGYEGNDNLIHEVDMKDDFDVNKEAVRINVGADALPFNIDDNGDWYALTDGQLLKKIRNPKLIKEIKTDDNDLNWINERGAQVVLKND